MRKSELFFKATITNKSLFKIKMKTMMTLCDLEMKTCFRHYKNY